MNAGVVAAVLAKAVEEMPAPVPFITMNAQLKARLSGPLQDQRKALFDFVKDEIIPLKQRLDGLGLDLAKIEKLQVDPASVVWTPPQLAADPFADAKFKVLDYKLGGADIRAAQARFKQVLTDISWSDPPNNLNETMQQFRQFLELKAMYIRVAGALGAAQDAGVTLAEALALYRLEGDLVAPLPQSHLDKSYPALERGFSFFFSTKWRLQLFPAMQNGLWGWKKRDIEARLSLAGKPDDVFDATLAFVALTDWHVIMWGGDFIGRKLGKAFTFDQYVKLSLKMRGGYDTIDVAVAAHQATVESLLVSLEVDKNPPFAMVAPTDAARLIRYALGEGLAFARRAGTLAVDGPFIAPYPRLYYLAHNTSHRRSATEATKDRFSWVLAEVAVALAKKTTAPAYCADAYARIKALTLPATLPKVPSAAEEASPQHADVATKLKNAGFSDKERDQFVDFIICADSSVAQRFLSHRKSLTRYLHIRAFYEGLTAGLGV